LRAQRDRRNRHQTPRVTAFAPCSKKNRDFVRKKIVGEIDFSGCVTQMIFVLTPPQHQRVEVVGPASYAISLEMLLSRNLQLSPPVG